MLWKSKPVNPETPSIVDDFINSHLDNLPNSVKDFTKTVNWDDYSLEFMRKCPPYNLGDTSLPAHFQIQVMYNVYRFEERFQKVIDDFVPNIIRAERILGVKDPDDVLNISLLTNDLDFKTFSWFEKAAFVKSSQNGFCRIQSSSELPEGYGIGSNIPKKHDPRYTPSIAFHEATHKLIRIVHNPTVNRTRPLRNNPDYEENLCNLISINLTKFLGEDSDYCLDQLK